MGRTRNHDRRTPEDEYVHYKNSAIRAAEDLGYPKSVIDDIIRSSTDSEISRIMENARVNYLGNPHYNRRNFL